MCVCRWSQLCFGKWDISGGHKRNSPAVMPPGEARSMPVDDSESRPRPSICNALVNRELDGGKSGCWEPLRTGLRVVFRQHDFLTCYSQEREGASGSECPPANQQCGSHGEQQVNDPRVRRDPEGESRPGDQRSHGHEKRRHAVYLVDLVDRPQLSSYFTSEWATVGSHVIEPTGPMKGPNAVADVMPLGGRQTLW